MQKGRDNNKFNQRRCKNANVIVNKRRRRSKDRGRRQSVSIPLNNRLNFVAPLLNQHNPLLRNPTSNYTIPTAIGQSQLIQPQQLQQMQQQMQQQLQQQMVQQMQQFDVYIKAAMNSFNQMMMKNQMEFERRLAALEPPQENDEMEIDGGDDDEDNSKIKDSTNKDSASTPNVTINFNVKK